jgi:hypothetical protein
MGTFVKVGYDSSLNSNNVAQFGGCDFSVLVRFPFQFVSRDREMETSKKM